MRIGRNSLRKRTHWTFEWRLRNYSNLFTGQLTSMVTISSIMVLKQGLEGAFRDDAHSPASNQWLEHSIIDEY